MVKDKDLVLGDIEAEMIKSSSFDELAPVHVVDSSDEQPSSSSATEPPAKKSKRVNSSASAYFT